jgi:hypothetical protein
MRHNIRLVIAFSIVTTIIAWIALMVSFWLPGLAGEALQATALSMGIPAIFIGGICFVMESELVEELEKRSSKETARTKPLRCSDCGTKILDASGTTVGDEIEGEIMMLRPGLGEHPWEHPPESPFDRKGR